jgi:hypothetical protein
VLSSGYCVSNRAAIALISAFACSIETPFF